MLKKITNYKIINFLTSLYIRNIIHHVQKYLKFIFYLIFTKYHTVLKGYRIQTDLKSFSSVDGPQRSQHSEHSQYLYERHVA